MVLLEVMIHDSFVVAGGINFELQYFGALCILEGIFSKRWLMTVVISFVTPESKNVKNFSLATENPLGFVLKVFFKMT